MMSVATEIELTPSQRDSLIGLAESQTAEVGLVRRASIVLLCADGFDNKTVGEIWGLIGFRWDAGVSATCSVV